jgi:hypothetical protein
MSDAPTLNQRLQRRHLSPVKDIQIFLRGTPKCSSLRRFIVRNTSSPTVFTVYQELFISTAKIFRLLRKMANLPISINLAFIPHQIKDYGVGIPAEITKIDYHPVFLTMAQQNYF